MSAAFPVTLFRDEYARSKRVRTLTLTELAEGINRANASSKEHLWLLKLATFGEKKTAKGCLRNNDNVLFLHGFVGEHDAETVSFEAAVALVREAGVRALLYTSPSHKPDKPRWRVIFPFGGQMRPEGHASMADRANALLGGVLSGESWTLSQAYYFGRVGSGEHFRIEVIEGDPIDTRPDLGSAGKPRRFTLDGLPEKLQKLIKGDAKKYDGHRSHLAFAVCCWLARLGWPAEAMVAILLNPQHPTLFEHCNDQNNPQGYALKKASEAIEKAGEAGGVWELDAEGVVVANSQSNIRKALSMLGLTLSYNEFAMKLLINGRMLDDNAADAAYLAIDERFKFRPTYPFFEKVMTNACHRNSFHPVRDYLDGLRWDGVPRIDDWLTTYGKAKNGDLEEEGEDGWKKDDYRQYLRAVGRLMPVAAVRRIRQPGCKFDEMLVLVDPTQGTNKSTALATLAVRPEWFTDALNLNARGREMIEQLAGKWIVEFAELKGMRDGHTDHVKALLSRMTDSGRPAYGHFTIDAERACVFFGTTNEPRFLKDDSGNRRFWPVTVGVFDIAGLQRDLDQLWAEAATIEATGESIRLDSKLWKKAETVQRSHREEEPWVEVIRAVLGDEMTGKVRSADIWTILGIVPGRQSQHDNRRIGVAMRELGWKPDQRRFSGAKASCYVRGTDAQEENAVCVIAADFLGGVAVASYEEKERREEWEKEQEKRRCEWQKKQGKRPIEQEIPF
jgi:predicted P-loop ATPase